MKKYLIAAMVLLSTQAWAQQTINGTIMHDGEERDYILYVPEVYDPSNAVPLVLNLHGYTSNAEQQMLYGNFRSIADTANFLLVHPNGLLDNTGTTHWNSGWGTGIDDVGFLSSLIDSLAVDYSINLDRVYSTGMSNGGFMSYHLACELSHRIAAIASVTGTMAMNTTNTCGASHPTPVMEIHGTADPTVPYDGNATMTPIPVVLLHWVQYNNCSPDPVVTPVPDVNTIDGCTAEHLLYPGGDNGVEVEHYRIIGGGHTWPGAILPIGVTNYDFNASEVIWQFFDQYDINGRVVGIQDELNGIGLNLFPNPGNGIALLQLDQATAENLLVEVYDNKGALVATSTMPAGSHSLKLSRETEHPGIYLVKISGSEFSTTKRLVVK